MILIALAAYALGSIPFGLLLTRAAGLGDIRKIGSGNIGATNVLRTGNKGLAFATLALDWAKGAAAVLIGQHFFGLPGVFIAGLAVILGHLFPIWLNFRGGKGVATGFGVLIVANPLIFVLSGAIWLLSAYLIRISSASSLIAFTIAPALAAVTAAPAEILGLTLAIAALFIFSHRTNIGRLIMGTEPKIGAK